jgi:methionyl-tRNA formyltransferase
MKISILCSDRTHPVYPYLQQWCEQRRAAHEVELVERSDQLRGGDILFLVSCTELIEMRTCAKYRASLVIHASDLPRGRGWSPLIWQILEGRSDIVVSLLEAAARVDSGAIWRQEVLHFEGHELHDEIHDALFRCELRLMDFAVGGLGRVTGSPQAAVPATVYRRRTPEDSRIDPSRSIVEQFDLLRVADPARYPAFFDHLGHRYVIRLTKAGSVPDEGN